MIKTPLLNNFIWDKIQSYIGDGRSQKLVSKTMKAIRDNIMEPIYGQFWKDLMEGYSRCILDNYYLYPELYPFMGESRLNIFITGIRHGVVMNQLIPSYLNDTKRFSEFVSEGLREAIILNRKDIYDMIPKGNKCVNWLKCAQGAIRKGDLLLMYEYITLYVKPGFPERNLTIQEWLSLCKDAGASGKIYVVDHIRDKLTRLPLLPQNVFTMTVELDAGVGLSGNMDMIERIVSTHGRKNTIWCLSGYFEYNFRECKEFVRKKKIPDDIWTTAMYLYAVKDGCEKIILNTKLYFTFRGNEMNAKILATIAKDTGHLRLESIIKTILR
jgi:hypothetical protein